MATVSYIDQSTPYGDTHTETPGYGGARRDVGATAFVWIAWALAAAFWAMVLSTALHIVGTPAPSINGQAPPAATPRA